jgi:hypothetical protein
MLDYIQSFNILVECLVTMFVKMSFNDLLVVPSDKK